MFSANAAASSRNNFTVRRNKFPQNSVVLVINLRHVVSAEKTIFLHGWSSILSNHNLFLLCVVIFPFFRKALRQRTLNKNF